MKPLTNNLARLHHEDVPTNDFGFFIGDVVSGVCIRDGKKYKGIVQYIRWDDSKRKHKKPLFVYVQELEGNRVIPLDPKHLSKYDEFDTTLE